MERGMTQRRNDKAFERLLSHVSKAIRSQRSALGLTQAQLGERADLTDKFISRIETEGENITLSSLSSLAKALKLKPGDLLPSSTDRDEHTLARQCKAVIDSVDDNKAALEMMLELLKVAQRQCA